jgi:hypothetical protein
MIVTAKMSNQFERDESTLKCEFPASIEIKICEIFGNAESSIKSTSRGIIAVNK